MTQEQVLQIFENARPVIDVLGVDYKRQDLAEYIERGYVEPWALPLWNKWVKECYQGGNPYTVLLPKQEEKAEQLELFV
jgi:hypothetical protein